jgi:hypothetical protein
MPSPQRVQLLRPQLDDVFGRRVERSPVAAANDLKKRPFLKLSNENKRKEGKTMKEFERSKKERILSEKDWTLKP